MMAKVPEKQNKFIEMFKSSQKRLDFVVTSKTLKSKGQSDINILRILF